MKKINPGHVLVAGCCLALMLGVGFGVGISVKAGLATRNSAGTYSLFTPGNPIVTGTVSNATTMNNTLSDIATSLTDSLDRNGKGGMLAALRGTDGTVAAPAFSWTSETGSGLFRNGTNDVRMSIGGTARSYWNALGLGLSGAAVTYPLEVNGATDTASSIGISNSGISGTPILHLSMNSGNSAGLFEIQKTSGSPTLGYKFFTMNSGSAVGGFSIPAAGGVTIGATGTTISASYRGTTSWNPGSIAGGGGNATTTITLTGAAAGADCFATPPVPNVALPVTCWVTLNTCTLSIVNQSAAAISPGSGTYACRVLNP